MSNKYTEAFDSLSSDEQTKRERTERILSAQAAEKVQVKTAAPKSAAKARKPVNLGRRGVALITAFAVLGLAVGISVPAGIIGYNNRGLLGAMAKLKNTFVDMDGVTAFGVWNAPDKEHKTGRISNVVQVRNSARNADDEATDENESDIISGDWSDDERYDWESDYDWDPTKANVLIAINDDGSISEVIYERTNGRGQVRQSALGNAAAVYVSDGFTYVMYVDDDEWEFWQDINFAQEMRTPNGFHCHHESMQTVVIHNETGKVFALKDLIPQVNELSGAMNYTMQVHPCKEDYLYLTPMYGDRTAQWYSVVYDEQTENLRYEQMVPVEVMNDYRGTCYVRAARRDKYGQIYLLRDYNNDKAPSPSAGLVELPSYKCCGNALALTEQNAIMFGTDKRVYAFDDGKLKVFGENFELTAVEPGIEVTFEGITNEFFDAGKDGNDGISYKLSNGYLYSMFGQVWTVDDDGALHEYTQLSGSFPRYADDGLLINGEIIAFVDTALTYEGPYAITGKIVHIRFDSTNGEPSANITHIMNVSEFDVSSHRLVVELNENPYKSERGDTRYFLITVQDGRPIVDYFGYGRDGGINGLTRPITEPLVFS